MGLTLKEFLELNKLSPAAFGGMIGLSANAIRNYLKGKREPGPEIRAKMEEVTGCVVTLTVNNILFTPKAESEISTAA